MYIKKLGNTSSSTASSGLKKTSGGSNFASYLGNTSGAKSTPISSTSSISINNAILSTQIVGEEEEKKKKEYILKRADNLIGKLEQIRDGLLSGYISRDKLVEISRFLKEKAVFSEDEKLNYLVSEIELRVEVELAKLMK